MYFTQDTENAIIRYNASTNFVERNQIYNEYLKVPLEKLAENIINTFKFSYFDDRFLNVKNETVAFMVEKMHQYDAAKGKAFSYFSIVAKNYLILNNNTNYKRFKSHDEIDILDLNRNFQSEHKEREKNSEDSEFISMLVVFWEQNLPNLFRKKRDIQIAQAVVELFRRIDSIENFNKKALYVLIREMADCKTQQITKIINTMKKYYHDMAVEYRVVGDLDSVYSNKFF